MRYGFLQFAPERLALEANRDRIMAMLHGARDAFVVAPELALSGYLFEDEEELRSTALEVADALFEPLLALLARNGLWLVLGFPERIEDGCYNSALLAGPEGLVTVYRKIHLFDREQVYFRPGEAPPPVKEAAGGRIGLMVCYDWFFPETARYLGRNGAQVIAHPANLVLPWCLDAMITRSLENRVFSITANRTGRERAAGVELEFYGRSQMVDPDGKRLLQAGTDDEGLFLVEIDPGRADRKSITGRNPGPSEVRVDLLG